MFNKMGDLFKQLQTAQRLMKDERFRALISHPKVQTLLQDPDFRALLTSQDPAKPDFATLTSNPKLAALLRDPEVAALFSRINPATLLNET